MSSASGPARILNSKDILPIVVFLFFFLGMFSELFFLDRTFFDRDFTLREIPSRQLATRLLKEGRFALWTDAYGGGQPFLANPKNAVFYPASLFYLLLPFMSAFKLYYLIHAVLTWTGLYFLGKSYSLSRRSSFLSASIFIFGGMYLSSFEFYNHVAALAWLPWILLLLHLPVRRRALRLMTLAVFWMLAILAGAPELTLLTLILGALQVLILDQDRWRRLVLTAASFFLAVLLSAVQLVPSLELWKQGPRGFEPTADWPLEIVQLLNLPFADILGKDRQPGHSDFWSADFFSPSYPLYYSMYYGIAALTLSVCGLRKLRDRKTAFLTMSAMLFLILAGGWHSPLHQFIGALPLMSSIRYPVKYFLGSVFAGCLLAGQGFERLFGEARVRPRSVLCLAGGLAVIGAIVGLGSSALSEFLSRSIATSSQEAIPEIRAALLSGAGLAVLCGMIVFIAALLPTTRQPLSVLLLAIIVFDLAYHNRQINPLVPTSFYSRSRLIGASDANTRVFREDDVPKQLKRGKTNNINLSLYVWQSYYPLTGIGEDVFYLFDDDFLDIYPREYRDLTEAFKKCGREGRVKILQTEGCRYYISHRPMPGLDALALNTSEGVLYAHELTGVDAAVRLVHDSLVATSPGERLRLCLGSQFDPGREVIVDRPVDLGHPPPGSEAEAVEILESHQGMVRVRAALSAKGIIVFSGNLAKGWRALVDDRPAEILRANLNSKGIFVTEGRHTVELVYAPGAFRVGAFISAVSLLSLALLGLFSALAKRRGAKPVCSDDVAFL